jgi:5-(carboxyamino)imidazole ribonucleotide mutase
LPVIAVPVKRNENDHEALWSNIKMPPGIPLATMPENGAKNAALLAVEILSLHDAELRQEYEAFRQKQHDDVVATDKNLNPTD